MPVHASRMCLHPGCNATYTGTGAYCPIHAPLHKRQEGRDYATKRDGERQAFETSPRWRRIRKMYLSGHPLCHDCQVAGLTVQAREVHHRDNDWRNNGDDNLMALCKRCHTRRTARGE